MTVKFAVFVCLFIAAAVAAPPKGILEIDEITFKKLVDGSKHVLVYFDEYTWSSGIKDFKELGTEFADDTDVLIARVATKDNAGLKDRFGISKVPAVKFFPKGAPIDAPLDGPTESVSDVSAFLRAELNPELKSLKALAQQFAASPSDAGLEQVKAKCAGATGSVKEFCDRLTPYLEKVKEKGSEFVQKETARIKGLMDSKSTKKEKQQEFRQKLQVLSTLASAKSEL